MHGQYLSAGWPLDRGGGARAHGGTAGGQTRDSEAAARNRRAPVQGTFLLRGLEKVRAEFSLTALAYNFIRVVNIVGVAALAICRVAPGNGDRYSKTAMRASACVLNVRRSSNSHSSVAKKLSASHYRRRLRPTPSRGEHQPPDIVCRTRSRYTASLDPNGGSRRSAAAARAPCRERRAPPAYARSSPSTSRQSVG